MFWLERGVFRPFSQNVPLDRWDERDLQAYFEFKVKTIREKCNVAFPDTTLNPDLLMQVTLRLYLDLAVLIPNDGNPVWVARDPTGLELWPFRATPCTISFGHKTHGRAMTTGYTPGLEYPTDQIADFNATRCNIALETWSWNWERLSYPDEMIPLLLERHRQLRSGPEQNRFWEMDEEYYHPGDRIKLQKKVTGYVKTETIREWVRRDQEQLYRRRQQYQLKRAHMTQEEIDAYNRTKVEQRKQRESKMTAQQKSEYKAQMEAQRLLTPSAHKKYVKKDRKLENEKARIRRLQWSPERKEREKIKARESTRRRLAMMTPTPISK